MNKWYDGKIAEYAVNIFLSDDFTMDWWSDIGLPQHVIEECEAIRRESLFVRSLSGAQKVLQEHGWSNS